MSKLNQQAQSVNPEFPPVRPVLDLRFALAKKLDPRVIFTRGTTGTYTGSDGLIKTAAANEPRFDHDPITGESKGLLMEQGRTNFLTYSEDFSNWVGGNFNLSTNSTISPDGNLTADRIYDDTTTSQKFAYKNTTIPTGTAITISVFVKFDSPNRNFILEITDAQSGGSKYSSVRLYSNGTYNTVASDFSDTRVGVLRYSNGWYRVYVSLTTSTITTITTRLVLENASPLATNYTGDGNSGLYVWGAQLEAGTYPTSYMPTTISTFARGGDIATIQGTNFTNIFKDGNFDELSVLYIGYSPDSVIGRNPNSGIVYWSIDNLIISEAYSHQYAGLPQFIIFENGISILGTFTFSVDLLNLKSMCLIDKSECRIIINEFFPDYEFSKTTKLPRLPTGMKRLTVGGSSNDGAQINGPIERLTIYTKKLSVNQAQSLTL